MKDHVNAASRVLGILDTAKQKGDNEKVYKVWGDIFNVEGEAQSAKNFEISKCLTLVYEEVEAIRHQMSTMNFGSHLYEPYLNRIHNVIALQTLMNDWAGCKGSITNDVTAVS